MTGTTSTFRLGDWLIEPAVNRVSRDEEAHHLEAKAMDVLVYLIEHAGRVVPTEALLADVWPGRIVEQSTAHHRINQIRKVLGDDARSPEYIQTIPKRGYRLIAPVAVIAAPAGELEQNLQRKPLMATGLALGSGAFVVVAHERFAASRGLPARH